MSDRNALLIRKQIEVAKDDYEWFLNKHPKASLSWISNILLQAYRSVCERDGVDTLSIAHIAAEDAKEEIESSNSSNSG